MNATATHYWIAGGLRADRERAVTSLRLPTGLRPAVDAHRRLRGPYTAAGALARSIVPGVLERDPGLVRRYDIELLSAAPELAVIVPNSRETLTSMAIPAERTRFYARLRTRRIANGMVEFLLGALPATGPRTLIIENTDHADRTDTEFLAAALRRIDPARLTIVICSQTRRLADDTLIEMLTAHAQLLPVQTAGPADRGPAPADPPGETADPSARACAYVQAADTSARACAYVQTDCTSDDPLLIEAYDRLGPKVRAALHDRRAAELADRRAAELADKRSPRLGAIPYHRS